MLVSIFAVAAGEANSAGLSPNQLARLERGEVVLLDQLPSGGMKTGQGGTAVAMVHASAEAVWRVLVDYAGHRGLYPRVVAADVVESDAAHALVRYVVGVGPFSFGFHVNNYPDPGRRRLEWRLDHGRRNDLFRDSWDTGRSSPAATASC